MGWGLAWCHEATWLWNLDDGSGLSLHSVSSASTSNVRAWRGLLFRWVPCPLGKDSRGRAAIPRQQPSQQPSQLLLLLPSPSPPVRELDLTTNEFGEGKGGPQLSADCLGLGISGWMVSPFASLLTLRAPGVSLWVGERGRHLGVMVECGECIHPETASLMRGRRW